MTKTRSYVRWSAWMLALAGLLYLPLPFIPDWVRIDDIGGTNWWLVYHMATIHHFLALLGLFGLFCAQIRESGWLGFIALATTSLGNALVGAIGVVQLTILPVFAANPEARAMLICTPFYTPATAAAEGFIETACAAWSFAVLELWVGVSWLTLILGSVALGIAIVRAAVLPRWTGGLLALGWLYILVGLVVPLPASIENLGLAIVGAGYLACGAALWMRFAPQPVDSGAT